MAPPFGASIAKPNLVNDKNAYYNTARIESEMEVACESSQKLILFYQH